MCVKIKRQMKNDKDCIKDEYINFFFLTIDNVERTGKMEKKLYCVQRNTCYDQFDSLSDVTSLSITFMITLCATDSDHHGSN
jgi:hypothetical protein